MPRFFFNLADGYVDLDSEGVELDDLQAARIQAVIFAGSTLKEQPERVWDGQELRVEVTDGRGLIQFTVITLAVDAASTAKKRPQKAQT